jgi:hypothetical protein
MRDDALTENLEREAREAGVVPNLATALVAEGVMTPDGEATKTPPRWDRFARLYLPSDGSFEGRTRIAAKLKRRYYERRRREIRNALLVRPVRAILAAAIKGCVMLRSVWTATLPFWYVAGLTMAVTLGTVLALLILNFRGWNHG